MRCLHLVIKIFVKWTIVAWDSCNKGTGKSIEFNTKYTHIITEDQM